MAGYHEKHCARCKFRIVQVGRFLIEGKTDAVSGDLHDTALRRSAVHTLRRENISAWRTVRRV